MCQCEDLSACKKSLLLDNRVDFLYDNELGSDVVFLVGIEPEVWRIPGHKKILSEANPVFRALLEGPLATSEKTIVIEDVESRAFDYVLRFLYRKEVSFRSPSTALSTLYAAHKYLCSGLIELCVKYLDENLNVRNVLEIFTHARLYAVKEKLNDFEPSAPAISTDINGLLTPTHCYLPTFSNNNNNNSNNNNNDTRNFPKEDLKGLQASSIPFWSETLVCSCLQCIDENADQVLNQEGIEDMSAEDLKEIVQRDSLRIKSEYVVFSALDRWTNRECKRRKLNLNPKNRRTVLGDLVFEIRFPFFTPEEFILGPIQNELLNQQELAFFSTLISKSKNTSSVPQKWKCHMEKVCKKRIYNEKESAAPSQKIYLIEPEKNKNLRKNYSLFGKIKNKNSKSTKGRISKGFKAGTEEDDRTCSKCFPECLIDILPENFRNSLMNKMTAPTFLIKNGSSDFMDKQKNLFDVLNSAEEKKSSNIIADEFMEVERKSKKRKRKETKHFRGKESLFKEPLDLPLRFKKDFKVPDFRKNPHKWTKYSLANVTQDDMSNESNTAAALAFLKDIKINRKQHAIKMETDESESKKILFSPHKFSLEFRQEEPVLHKQRDPPKSVFKSTKLIMPEYVVGQVKRASKVQKKKMPGEKSKEIYLNHIHEFEDE